MCDTLLRMGGKQMKRKENYVKRKLRAHEKRVAARKKKGKAGMSVETHRANNAFIRLPLYPHDRQVSCSQTEPLQV